MEGNKKRINCFHCKFFFLTWKPHRPYGCKAFSMETKMLPSRHVFLESRKKCLYFEIKENHEK